MNQDTYEQEIDLKDLMFSVLKKWRGILLLAVVLGVILGGYKLASAIKTNNNPEYIAEQKDNYAKDLESYENKRIGLEQEVENINRSLEELNEYQEQSVLMQISPCNKPVATAELYVNAEDGRITGNLIKIYESLLKQEQLVEKLSQEFNMDSQYIQELITVNSYAEGVVAVEKGENSLLDGLMEKNTYLTENINMLEIQVTHVDKETAQDILDTLLDCLEQESEDVATLAGVHTLQIMNQGTTSIVDTGLSDWQQKMTSLKTSLDTTLTAKQTELDGLEEPKEVSTSMMASLKQGIKYGILGGVLGAFVYVFFVCVAFLMSDKLYSEKELKNRFGLKILGVMPTVSRKRAFAGIDNWLEKLEGRNVQISEGTVYQVIAANIKNYMGDGRKILVTGKVDNQKVDEILAQLRVILPEYEWVAGGDMAIHPDTLQKLPECDGVVLVEERSHTTYSAVAQELETIGNVGKNVVGAVVL